MSWSGDIQGSRISFAAIAFEKGHYPFKNYRHAHAKSVLFPGCNFPSLFPRTCSELVKLLHKQGDIGVAYDCCGKPIGIMGRKEAFERILGNVAKRLSAAGVEEVICVCPNCYYTLRNHIPQRVVSIYEKLAELGFSAQTAHKAKRTDEFAILFPPCPDRHEGIFTNNAQSLLPKTTVVLDCPGASGSCRKSAECQGCKALPCCRQVCPSVIEKGSAIMTACASCSGYFKTLGYGNVRFALSEILDIEESPACHMSFLNRARTKFL